MADCYEKLPSCQKWKIHRSLLMAQRHKIGENHARILNAIKYFAETITHAKKQNSLYNKSFGNINFTQILAAIKTQINEINTFGRVGQILGQSVKDIKTKFGTYGSL